MQLNDWKMSYILHSRVKIMFALTEISEINSLDLISKKLCRNSDIWPKFVIKKINSGKKVSSSWFQPKPNNAKHFDAKNVTLLHENLLCQNIHPQKSWSCFCSGKFELLSVFFFFVMISNFAMKIKPVDFLFCWLKFWNKIDWNFKTAWETFTDISWLYVGCFLSWDSLADTSI